MYFCAPLINFAKPYGTKKQETALTGLSDKEVLINREKYGNNLLTPPKRPSMWKLYLEKFRDPVIRILLVAAFFSLVIAIIENEYAETIGIFFAIFWQPVSDSTLNTMRIRSLTY